VAARFLPNTQPLRRVSILPRGLALGATQQVSREDRHLATRGELLSRLGTMMGGYAAEQVVFGEVSTGAESDLKQATELATQMVAHYGMSDRLGPVYFDYHTDHPFLGKRVATEGGASDVTGHLIEKETQRLLAEALGVARGVVTAHRASVDRLAAALVERETLELGALEDVLAASDVGSPRVEPGTPGAVGAAAFSGRRS
jgi:cell division protease FtsH